MRNEGVARVLFQERELAAGCNETGVYVFTSK